MLKSQEVFTGQSFGDKFNLQQRAWQAKSGLCNRVEGTRRCIKRERNGECTPEDLRLCQRRDRTDWIIAQSALAQDRESRKKYFRMIVRLIQYYDFKRKLPNRRNYCSRIIRLNSCANVLFIRLARHDSFR
ncbi:MAG: hypothetical protein Q8O93_04580 [bacterium]|nr:hypothetical protein [bacterium]